MISDLAIYYEDHGNSVSPFLIAPVLEQQDTLIIGPRNVASEHDRFLNECFRKMPRSLGGFLYLRVFTYKSRVAIILVLPTCVEEESSKRTGLALTLGALVDKRVFKDHHKPSSYYFHRFVHLVNSFLKVDLFANGADEIVRQINNESRHSELRFKFSLVLDSLLISSARLSPRNLRQRLMPRPAWIRGVSELPWRALTKREPKTLPKVILCSHLDSKPVTQLFLWEIDRYLSNSHIRNIDVANQASSGGRSIEFIPLERLPLNKITRLSLVRSYHHKYLKLY
jgi:hypothetical protein